MSFIKKMKITKEKYLNIYYPKKDFVKEWNEYVSGKVIENQESKFN